MTALFFAAMLNALRVYISTCHYSSPLNQVDAGAWIWKVAKSWTQVGTPDIRYENVLQHLLENASISFVSLRILSFHTQRYFWRSRICRRVCSGLFLYCIRL